MEYLEKLKEINFMRLLSLIVDHSEKIIIVIAALTVAAVILYLFKKSLFHICESLGYVRDFFYLVMLVFISIYEFFGNTFKITRYFIHVIMNAHHYIISIFLKSRVRWVLSYNCEFCYTVCATHKDYDIGIPFYEYYDKGGEDKSNKILKKRYSKKYNNLGDGGSKRPKLIKPRATKLLTS